jgi:hypothetical protein
MDELKVYNNGNGWRIGIYLGGDVHVLTVEQATELYYRLYGAIHQILFDVSEKSKSENG